MMKEIWAMEKNQKICAFDIDGVISDYPKCWVDFVNIYKQKEFSDLNEIKNSLSYSEYKKIKGIYRSSGYKKTLPLKKNASETIKKLQESGYKVILLTARPYRQYRNIWRDTIEWLNNNSIYPDGIIWDKDKHWAVLQQFPYLKFMVDDNAEIANQVAKIGYKVYVLDNEYNRQELEKNVSRIKSLDEILTCEVFK